MFFCKGPTNCLKSKGTIVSYVFRGRRLISFIGRLKFLRRMFHRNICSQLSRKNNIGRATRADVKRKEELEVCRLKRSDPVVVQFVDLTREGGEKCSEPHERRCIEICRKRVRGCDLRRI